MALDDWDHTMYTKVASNLQWCSCLWYQNVRILDTYLNTQPKLSFKINYLTANCFFPFLNKTFILFLFINSRDLERKSAWLVLISTLTTKPSRFSRQFQPMLTSLYTVTQCLQLPQKRLLWNVFNFLTDEAYLFNNISNSLGVPVILCLLGKRKSFSSRFLCFCLCQIPW